MSPVDDGSNTLLAGVANLHTAVSERCAKAQKPAEKTHALAVANKRAIESRKAILERIEADHD